MSAFGVKRTCGAIAGAGFKYGAVRPNLPDYAELLCNTRRNFVLQFRSLRDLYPAPDLIWAQDETKRMQMSNAFQVLLDSGMLYLVIGAVICICLGVGAARRLFQGAKRVEPPDSQHRLRPKD